MRSGEKGLFPGPHPPSATVPPLPEGESSLVEYGFCDFVFGSPQNDRGWEVLEEQKFSFQRNRPKMSLVLCVLVTEINF